MLELLTALIDVDGNKEKSAATTTRHLLARSILRHDCIVQPSRAYSWWRRRVNVQVMARGVCVASFVASPFSLLFFTNFHTLYTGNIYVQFCFVVALDECLHWHIVGHTAALSTTRKKKKRNRRTKDGLQPF